MRNAMLTLALAAGAMLLVGRADAEPAKVGAKAPEFTLKDHAGKEHKLSDYKGKTVVLEWFNPGCPYVVRHYESKTMKNLAEQYGTKDVVWLAVNTGGDPQQMKTFAEHNKLPYPVLIDKDGQTAKAYGAKTTPHMFVIDRKGNLAYAGAIDNDPNGENSADRVNYVAKALNELAAGKAVSTPETKSYGCGVKAAP